MSDSRLRFLLRAAGAVVSQGSISLAHFLAGWLLLRATGPEAYAQWVLMMGTVTLLVSLQFAFLGPTLSLRMPALGAAGRTSLVGALLGEQGRLLNGLRWFGACGLAATAWLQRDAGRGPLLLALVLGLVAAQWQLRREFLRQVLYAANLGLPILAADLAYSLLLVVGVVAACELTGPWKMAAASLALALAAGAARQLLKHHVDRVLAPVGHRRQGLSREMAPLALWSTSGAALAWTTSQGFLYLAAVHLGPLAVAALAAARLPLMPMNLLVSGLGGLMVPSAARWLATHGQKSLRRRIGAMAALLGTVTGLWTLAIWAGRESVLAWLSPQSLPHAASLLAGWGLVYTLLAVRDTLSYIPAAAGRYRQLTLLTAIHAVVTLIGCVAGMAWLADSRGALLGVLVGETGALMGVLWLVSRAAAPTTGINPAGTVSPA